MKKVLFTYIGGSSPGSKPLSIALLSSILKKKGHKTILFDTTFMDLGFALDGEISDSVKQFKKVDWGKHHLVRDARHNPKKEFINLIEREKPDVIASNTMSDMYNYTMDFLRLAKSRFNIPVIIGGIHPTVLPEEVIKEDCVDALCIGEGEKAILEFVESIENQQIKRTDIENLWIKIDGKVYKNKLAPLVDVNELPFLDYSIFEERQFLRPFEGKILRSGDVQDMRGCPRICPYCANAVLNKIYPGRGLRPFRPDRYVDEVEYLVKTYNLEFFKVFSEDMFLRNTDDLALLSRLYKKKVNVPFVSRGYPKTVTEEKAKMLKDMNCVSISMALEEGSYEYRKDVLKRNYTDKEYIKKVRVLKDAGIRTVSLNMMGLPYETEKMIFKTFSLLKKARPSLANISMFFPYRGTPLGDLCIEKGFTKEETVKNARSDMSKTILTMPQIKQVTLNGIRRMAHYYINYPTFLYPLFKMCHRENKFTNLIIKILNKIDTVTRKAFKPMSFRFLARFYGTKYRNLRDSGIPRQNQKLGLENRNDRWEDADARARKLE